tara:strand:+ start:5281 stop:5790 length:510 start_codon:yes stop_codon:yes gene_type:complete
MDRTHGSAEDISKELYVGCSLVDITRTGVLAPYKSDVSTFVDSAKQIVNDESAWTRSRSQQTNWETIIQVISIRTQPMSIRTPKLHPNVDLDAHQFGSLFTGLHNVWIFSFGVEHRSIFANKAGYFGSLFDDMHNIPVVTDLLETIEINIPVFNTLDESLRNLYIYKLD